MSRKTPFLLGTFVFILPALAAAGPRDDILARYAEQAQRLIPAFSGFSAERGQAFYNRSFAGGKAETPACTSCHGTDPRHSGQTLSGKAIDPVAVSTAPARYTDSLKVEKWFKRNCNEVLGRPCTVLEKGDWLTYVSRQ